MRVSVDILFSSLMSKFLGEIEQRVFLIQTQHLRTKEQIGCKFCSFS